MYTWAPYAQLHETVQCLDNATLLVVLWDSHEVHQIILPKSGKLSPKYSDPCVRMWHGYHHGLAAYFNACLVEWRSRGFETKLRIITPDWRIPVQAPPWWGDETVHASHRAELTRTNPYYEKYKWRDSGPMIWPTWDWQRRHVVDLVKLIGG